LDHYFNVGIAMTNVNKKLKASRKDVLSPQEVDLMLRKANKVKLEYFRLRAKAIVGLFKTGKRRAEVAALEVADLKVQGDFLYIAFTVVKKRKKTVLALQRTKRFPLSSPHARRILAYWNHMKKVYPKCKYLFPSVTSVFGQAFIMHEDKHLSGRQILRIIKQLNPRAWCHLFRETRGAEVVRADEKRLGEASIMTVYRVKHALDLERETTAWNYINRYATETIEAEEEIDYL